MSMEELEADTAQVVAAAKALGPLTTTSDLVAFIKHNLTPLVTSAIAEIGEVDETVYGLVHESDDVLHEDTAKLFSEVIQGGAELARELAKLAAGDARIAGMIQAWQVKAKQAAEVLDDITSPDPDAEDPEADTAEDTDEAETPAEGKPE